MGAISGSRDSEEPTILLYLFAGIILFFTACVVGFHRENKFKGGLTDNLLLPFDFLLSFGAFVTIFIPLITSLLND